jgi:transcriptional regulator with XRE-family HTH domain
VFASANRLGGIVTPEQIERNRHRQADLYGEPLGDMFRRVADTLGLNQAKLSDIIGISRPMMSQLMNAQRVKIGNPAVLQRVQALSSLADDVIQHAMGPSELAERLADVAKVTGAFSTTTQAVTAIDPRAAVRIIQGLLRHTASGAELLVVADKLESDHPALAEALRVYGLGRTDTAVDHYRHIQQML